MTGKTPYDPQSVFSPSQAGNQPVPRIFVSPARYIQGEGVIDHTGHYLQLLNTYKAGLLMSDRCLKTDGARLIRSLESRNVDVRVARFGGESSLAEIEAHVEALSDDAVGCLIAIGGGKCIDAGKSIAWRLGVPVIIVPTLASNDAPCSALSVIYTPDGVTESFEFFPDHPSMVIVDTGIVAEAPERFLVAGMGDAMATWYEARVCLENPAARTTVGARPTIASAALGEKCASTLFDSGVAAAKAVQDRRVDESLEMVVEANTLLSGLGFESGGVAAAHGIAQSYTILGDVHHHYLHGEMVAMGLLAQLVMESRPEEALRVGRFFASVGLPVHLGQLSLQPGEAILRTLSEAAIAFPMIHNMPFEVTPQVVTTAITEAHQLGLDIVAECGDTAYRRLQKD